MTLTLSEILTYVQPIAITVGGLYAVFTYRGEAKRRRSEWIYRLYTQFYETDRFKRMRRLVDYAPEEEIKRLTRHIEVNADSDLHEDFADYLNFFEFLAIQHSYGNVKRQEIMDMFEYYLRRLKEQDYIVAYLDTYGFEHLSAFLRRM